MGEVIKSRDVPVSKTLNKINTAHDWSNRDLQQNKHWKTGHVFLNYSV